MKHLFIFIFFSFISLKAQNQIEVLSAFIGKDICLLKRNISYPLTINNINDEVDSVIITEKNIDYTLKKIFSLLTDEELKKAEILKFDNLKYGIIIRVFNGDNELESESIINFYFKEIKKKKYLLIKIELIG